MNNNNKSKSNFRVMAGSFLLGMMFLGLGILAWPQIKPSLPNGRQLLNQGVQAAPQPPRTQNQLPFSNGGTNTDPTTANIQVLDSQQDKLEYSNPLESQKPATAPDVISQPAPLLQPNQNPSGDPGYERLVVCLDVLEQSRFLVSPECLGIINTEKMRCAGSGDNYGLCERIENTK